MFFRFPKTMSTYQLYRNTTLGHTLQESLDELIQVVIWHVNVAAINDPLYCGGWGYLSFLSFFIYCQTLFRVLSAGVLCTLRVAGWKPTSNHIEITVGFFNLHKGWLFLHRGHPVNIPIRRTMHLSSVIPANDTRESMFGHPNFPRRELQTTRPKTNSALAFSAQGL